MAFISEEKAIKVLQREKLCINKNIENLCDRDCANCDLLMEDSDIINTFNLAIQVLGERLKIKDLDNPDLQPHIESEPLPRALSNGDIICKFFPEIAGYLYDNVFETDWWNSKWGGGSIADLGTVSEEEKKEVYEYVDELSQSRTHCDGCAFDKRFSYGGPICANCKRFYLDNYIQDKQVEVKIEVE